MFVKLSILLFYKRVFSNEIRLFSIFLIVVGVYVFPIGTGSAIEYIVRCLPIRYFFTRAYEIAGNTESDPVKDKNKRPCLPQNLHVAIPLVAGLVSDIAILLLPSGALCNTKIARVKKFSAYFALSLGMFACAIEIV